jgi:hypothetical protein
MAQEKYVDREVFDSAQEKALEKVQGKVQGKAHAECEIYNIYNGEGKRRHTPSTAAHTHTAPSLLYKPLL